MIKCEYCGKSARRNSLRNPDCNYCSASPSYHHGRCCPYEPSFKKDSSVMSQDLNPQISESSDEQTQERTKAAENDQVIHEVKLAVSPAALSPSTCVPKPRPPTPFDTLVQRAECTKTCRFIRPVWDHVPSAVNTSSLHFRSPSLAAGST